MEIKITKRLVEKYPNVRFFAIIVKNIQNKKKEKKLEKEKRKIEEEIRKNVKDPSKIKLVIDYNKFFNKFGSTVPIKFQLNSILNGKKIPTETVLKDVLFMIELKHACLVSGHDLDLSSGKFTFDLSQRDEIYKKINNKEQKLKPDDIILKDSEKIVTSLLYGPGYYDRINDNTKNCLYLFWFNEKVSDKELNKYLNNFKKYLKMVSKEDTKVELVEVIKEKDEKYSTSDKIIDPWGSTLIEDYNKLIDDFYLEVFDPRLFPNPNRLMRRKIVFSGIGLKPLAEAIKKKKPFYVLSGIMPSAKKIHFGTKMVVEMISYFQSQGAETYILVADLEANATRDISLEEARKRALNFHIPAYITLGLDPKKTIFYFQSENIEVMHAAYKYSKKVTLAQFQALYGSGDPDRIFAALTQVGDIIYPQFKKRMLGVIPVGPDQCPHILLTRDIVNRMKKEKFVSPSATFHKYMPSLNGHFKMSKSMPESMIELPEDPKTVCKKLKRALTGGRDTVEEQKSLGGIPEKCMIFELYKQHLIEEDNELQNIYKTCKAGTLLCGEDKEYACKKMTEFMNKLEKGIKEAKKNIDKLKFIKN